ncbi:MAG TPA: hypothetical protein VMS18_17235 [Candidatus Binatia bacterium]|nr:hypothetical protein [Candidatus Binatia bacterium]
MSSAVVSTSAALGRPFLFDDESDYVGTAAFGCPVEQSSTESRRDLHQPTLNNPRSKLLPASVTPASRLGIRPAPEMATSGIPALDALIGGLPRGCLTEIFGSASSGRTSIMLAALASATCRGEYCAVIDAGDSLDPHSLAVAGIDLDRLLWVRCNENSPQRHRDTEKKNPRKESIANNCLGLGTIGKGASAVPYESHSDTVLAAEGHRLRLQESLFKQIDTDRTSKARTINSDEESRNRKQSEHRLEQVLRATDLLLESGGFGLIILDLADVPHQAARRIPLTTWFRFRRAVEHKPTILLAIEQQPIAGSCSSLLLQLEVPSSQLSVLSANQIFVDQNPDSRTRDPKPSHAHLLTELKIHAELIRSRLDRKPARSIAFETKTAWAG